MKVKIVLFAIFGLILDRISKLFVIKKLVLYKKNTIISNFFSITYVKNYGAAWGILNGNRWFLILITIVALFFIIYYMYKDKNLTKWDYLSYGLLLSGILGNLIDRIYYGYVIDLFDFLISNYDFPVFNIADMLIVISVGIMLISAIKDSLVRRCGNEDNNN